LASSAVLNTGKPLRTFRNASYEFVYTPARALTLPYGRTPGRVCVMCRARRAWSAVLAVGSSRWGVHLAG